MTTNLDVIDSAVKVGLGALLGGYFSFATQAFIQDRTRDRDKKKELRDRLYVIGTKIGKSFESTTHYISIAVVFNNNEFSSEARAEFEAADKESKLDWRSLLSTSHELELLGLKKSSTLAVSYFLSLSRSAEIVSDLITSGDETLRDQMHLSFEHLMQSLKDDYQSLF